MHIQTLHDVRSAGHHLLVVCRHPGCRHQQDVDLDRLINSVGPGAALLPARAEQHFTDRMRCQACKRRGVSLWLDPIPPKPAKRVHQPNYRIIDQGNAHPYEESVAATADNLMVARAAFAAAYYFYGDHWITLLQGTYVVADTRQDGPPEVLSAEGFRHMRDVEAGKADPTQAKIKAG